MTALSGRVQTAFNRTKTVCFGRFVVDVPETATVVWGEADIPLGVRVYQNGVEQVNQLAKGFIDQLKSQKAIYKNYVPLLVSVQTMSQQEGQIVTGYDGFEAIDEFKINGYFRMGDSGVIVESQPLGNRRDYVVAEINGIARRLRPRLENEVPTEAGNCIEHAFLPDKPNMDEVSRVALISVGVRFEEFPDAHFSIHIAPSNPSNPDSDSLENQFKRTFSDMTSGEEKRVLAHTKIFRQSGRQIHNWKTGFELLMRSPDEDGSFSHHDFRMRFVGVPHDVLTPYADIQFQTGVGDNAAGQIKASLTDEEALAVWDKITSTIRVRPTSAVPAKVAEIDSGCRRPLGELAVTGRACPQTGVWESSDAAGEIEDGKRRHFRAGERLPHVISQGEPSIWQKLKGERPSYRTATVWKLVSYDNAAGGTNVAVQVPGLANSDGRELGDDPTRPGENG
jgi:hypothetical protein